MKNTSEMECVLVKSFFIFEQKRHKRLRQADKRGELSHDELKQMISRLKERKFVQLIFSLQHPFSIEEK